MKNRKKLLTAGVSLAGIGVLALGAFAFLADEAKLAVNSNVGTVNIECDARISHTQLKREILAQNPTYGLAFSTGRQTTKDAPLIEVVLSNVSPDDFEEAPDNLNPGDNDYISSTINNYTRPGTDHEIEITITNKGSKSVATRALVEITGTAADNSPLTSSELRNVIVGFDPYNTFSGLSAVHAMYAYDDLLYLEPMLSSTNTKLVYGISEEWILHTDFPQINDYSEYVIGNQPIPEIIKSKFLLSGDDVFDNAEIEKYIYEKIIYNEETEVVTKKPEVLTAPESGTFKIDIGLDEEASSPRLEGASLSIKVTVQAMQFRNTESNVWYDVFSDDFVFKFAPEPH